MPTTPTPKALRGIDRFALRSTSYIGSPASLIIHTVLFIGIFALGFFGIALEQILLILTTLVSLEAIYRPYSFRSPLTSKPFNYRR